MTLKHHKFETAQQEISNIETKIQVSKLNQENPSHRLSFSYLYQQLKEYCWNSDSFG